MPGPGGEELLGLRIIFDASGAISGLERLVDAADITAGGVEGGARRIVGALGQVEPAAQRAGTLFDGYGRAITSASDATKQWSAYTGPAAVRVAQLATGIRAAQDAAKSVTFVNSAKQLDQLGYSAAGLRNQLFQLFAAVQVLRFLRDAVVDFAKEERSLGAIEAQLRAIGPSAVAAGADVRSFVAGVSQMTGSLDDDLYPALNRALLVFRDIKAAEEVLVIASKYAANGFGDVQSNVAALSTAFETGMSRSLRQFGIQTQDADGSARSFADAIAEIRKRADELPASLEDAQSQVNALALMWDNFKDNAAKTIVGVSAAIADQANLVIDSLTGATSAYERMVEQNQSALLRFGSTYVDRVKEQAAASHAAGETALQHAADVKSAEKAYADLGLSGLTAADRLKKLHEAEAVVDQNLKLGLVTKENARAALNELRQAYDKKEGIISYSGAVEDVDRRIALLTERMRAGGLAARFYAVQLQEAREERQAIAQPERHALAAAGLKLDTERQTIVDASEALLRMGDAAPVVGGVSRALEVLAAKERELSPAFIAAKELGITPAIAALEAYRLKLRDLEEVKGTPAPGFVGPLLPEGTTHDALVDSDQITAAVQKITREFQNTNTEAGRFRAALGLPGVQAEMEDLETETQQLARLLELAPEQGGISLAAYLRKFDELEAKARELGQARPQLAPPAVRAGVLAPDIRVEQEYQLKRLALEADTDAQIRAVRLLAAGNTAAAQAAIEAEARTAGLDVALERLELEESLALDAARRRGEGTLEIEREFSLRGAEEYAKAATGSAEQLQAAIGAIPAPDLGPAAQSVMGVVSAYDAYKASLNAAIALTSTLRDAHNAALQQIKRDEQRQVDEAQGNAERIQAIHDRADARRIASANALAATERNIARSVAIAKGQAALSATGQAISAAQEAFGASKGLAIASVLVNTAQAIVKGYADLGWIGGTIFAVVMTAIAHQQIAKIQSASPTGGGADVGTGSSSSSPRAPNESGSSNYSPTRAQKGTIVPDTGPFGDRHAALLERGEIVVPRDESQAVLSGRAVLGTPAAMAAAEFPGIVSHTLPVVGGLELAIPAATGALVGETTAAARAVPLERVERAGAPPSPVSPTPRSALYTSTLDAGGLPGSAETGAVRFEVYRAAQGAMVGEESPRQVYRAGMAHPRPAPAVDVLAAAPPAPARRREFVEIAAVTRAAMGGLVGERRARDGDDVELPWPEPAIGAQAGHMVPDVGPRGDRHVYVLERGEMIVDRAHTAEVRAGRAAIMSPAAVAREAFFPDVLRGDRIIGGRFLAAPLAQARRAQLGGLGGLGGLDEQTRILTRQATGFPRVPAYATLEAAAPLQATVSGGGSFTVREFHRERTYEQGGVTANVTAHFHPKAGLSRRELHDFMSDPDFEREFGDVLNRTLGRG